MPRTCNVPQPTVENPWGLTPAEAAVAQMVANGLCGKEIASALCVQIKTVENHRLRVVKKMGARNGFQAAVWWDRFIRDAKLARMCKFLPEGAVPMAVNEARAA